jgi:hypothetical protein
MQVLFARDGAPLIPALPAEVVPALLRTKAVFPSDLYWHEGMAEWSLVEAGWPTQGQGGSASPMPTSAVPFAPPVPSPSPALRSA